MRISEQVEKIYAKWRSDEKINRDGILVGCDITQEWLLSWWWEHYQKTNDSVPVAFVDLGLSDTAKIWCKERGELISLLIPDVFVVPKEEVDPSIVSQWEETFGSGFWASRTAWFKKPFACMLSPFRRTVWIDLDCEIRGSLSSVFPFAENPSGIAMRRELESLACQQVVYNSGVLVFKRGLPLFEEWGQKAFGNTHTERGDQEVLSTILEEKKIQIGDLPSIYNWSRCLPDCPNIVIYHWHGPAGKQVIAHQKMAQTLK